MGVESYFNKRDSDGEVYEFDWRGEKLLVNHRTVYGSSTQVSGVDIRVLGFCDDKRVVDSGTNYGFRIVPLRFQSNCRKFLRGISFTYIDNVVRFCGSNRKYHKK